MFHAVQKHADEPAARRSRSRRARRLSRKNAGPTPCSRSRSFSISSRSPIRRSRLTVADHLHAPTRQQARGSLRRRAVDHERGRDPRIAFCERRRRAVVAGWHAHRLPRQRRSARHAALRPLDGRRGRDVADHARRSEHRRHQWSPDGKSIGFSMLVPMERTWHIDMPAAAT